MEERAYHISVGFAQGNLEEKEINLLVNEAERRMYEEKAQFYQKKGIDRRSRR
ncbi:MAG: hypothetical protein ACI4FY_05760 [Acetatifactor sp.]